MTLPLPTTVGDPATQQCLDRTAEQFPIQAPNIAKGAVTNEKLAKPPIVGNVSAAGAVVVGTGLFTVVHTGTGIYTITLATELATNGLILAFSTEQNRAMRASTGIAKKVFVVNSVSLGEAAADTAFNFVIHPS